MRIVGIERNKFATNHYRILQPLYKLYEQGLAEVLTIEENNLDKEASVNAILNADLMLIYSPSSEHWLNLIKNYRKLGKIIVADYDDDPFNTSPLSAAYRYFGVEEVAYTWPDSTVDMLWEEKMTGSKGEPDFFNIERNIKFRDIFKTSFKKSDLISTTTEELKNEFIKINPNTVVLPNLVDFDMYPKCELVKKEIRIGWQGGSSHYEDLYLIIEPLKKILNKYQNVKFVFAGDMRFEGLFKQLPQNQVEYHSWVSHIVYPYKLVTMNLDIGLCPLVNSKFNTKKSAIKYFEYSVTNTATIASNINPYKTVITNEKDGLLVEDNNWFEAIERLILDKEKRLSLSKNAYENIYQNHNADTKAYLWKNEFEKLLNRSFADELHIPETAK